MEWYQCSTLDVVFYPMFQATISGPSPRNTKRDDECNEYPPSIVDADLLMVPYRARWLQFAIQWMMKDRTEALGFGVRYVLCVSIGVFVVCVCACTYSGVWCETRVLLALLLGWYFNWITIWMTIHKKMRETRQTMEQKLIDTFVSLSLTSRTHTHTLFEFRFFTTKSSSSMQMKRITQGVGSIRILSTSKV